jgi:diaminohydroxyphosphoribosylaminopyrimidine deaminase/5-amino-6-(5-phosphoribosylamino)uracil reductase
MAAKRENERVWRRRDEIFMDRAIELAWWGAGHTDPNPMVGAVLVRDGVIVGEGVHRRAGTAHAEVIAIDEAGSEAEGATLYTNLEPCSHFGKTPPCVDKITASGVERVVVATRDPFPEVRGRGLAKLRSAGIEVEVGVLKEKALLLNLGYFKRYTIGEEAAVTLKAAVSMDGKVAPSEGERGRITSEEAKLWGQRLRAAHKAILVGIDTILVDDPRLDCRFLGDVPAPVPAVLDPRLRFPESHEWLGKRRFYIFTGENAPDGKALLLEESGAKIVRSAVDGGRIDVAGVLKVLYADGIDSVMVEGGAKTLTWFIENSCWDALCLFVGPKLFGKRGVSLFQADHAENPEVIPAGSLSIGGDYLLTYLHRERAERILAAVS